MVHIDQTDTRILEALQNNARISFKDLAELTGTAPSTCLLRVRRLQAAGVIRAFRAEVDLREIGRPLEALVAIRIRPHSRALVEPFVRYVLGLPETLGLFNLAGPDDYLLHVAVADTEQLRTFVLDRLGSRAEVAHVQTSLVYEHVAKHVVEPIGEVQEPAS